MTEPIVTDPELMRNMAAEHDGIAEQIDTARIQAEQVAPAVYTWGPIMSRTKAAVTDVLAQHDQSLREEAAHHRRMAEELRSRAAAFEAADEANATRIRTVLS